MYKIVLVDDEPFELDTLEKYVPWEEMGFKVIGTAKNGKEALSKVGELLPDIVITDVKMPIMDGVEFADIMRERLPHLKIIFLSGYDDFSYVKAALQVEASGYLLKPLDVEELRKLMKKVKVKCMEEQRVKLSSRALAIQYIKEMLNEKHPQALKTIAAEIRSLGLEPLISSSGAYSFSLITIDEFPTLTKVIENGLSITQDIGRRIERLAETHDALIVSVNERQHLVLSVKAPLQDMLEWSKELGVFTRWITFCSNSRQSRLEELPSVYRKLLQTRNRHVLLNGAGHFIVADDGSANPESNPEPMQPPAFELLLSHVLHERLREAELWISEFVKAHTNVTNPSIGPVEQACLELLDQLYAVHVQPHTVLKGRVADKTTLLHKLSIIESIPLMEHTISQFVLQLIKAVAGVEGEKHTPLIRQLKELIKREYARPLSIDYLAEQVYMSPNYLRTIFKEYTGYTVLEYVTQVRMDQAMEMLQDGSLKIHEISTKVGYENASHFCAIFHKKRGLTPNQYRNQLLRL
ncbi:response regulator [Cohnella lupini]|uniref:Two-component system response regulator YesN n=1 Tax=Cohnella lupini TaxID=1294267 RepID=A0A3D9HYC6_9BACL|nr:response regulator [Cohnella lupini]RED54425.1 two-component system response regulator YesN [Cohnella lupini]